MSEFAKAGKGVPGLARDLHRVRMRCRASPVASRQDGGLPGSGPPAMGVQCGAGAFVRMVPTLYVAIRRG
jgi:hypothetical protein